MIAAMHARRLLGFDETIDAYCAAHGGRGQHSEACVRANVNILSLYGQRVPCTRSAQPRPWRPFAPAMAVRSPTRLCAAARQTTSAATSSGKFVPQKADFPGKAIAR